LSKAKNVTLELAEESGRMAFVQAVAKYSTSDVLCRNWREVASELLG
jgi:hypothetical protein